MSLNTYIEISIEMQVETSKYQDTEAQYEKKEAKLTQFHVIHTSLCSSDWLISYFLLVLCMYSASRISEAGRWVWHSEAALSLQQYSKVLFLRCLHLFPISVLLLIRLPLCRFLIMATFSDRHRSQDFPPVWQTSQVLRYFHVTLGVGFRPWSQTYFESAVSDLQASCWKLFL